MGIFRRLVAAWIDHVGRRGGFLLFLAILDVIYGYALIRHPLAGPHPYYELLPPRIWAGVWIAVGLACLIQAPMRHDKLAFVAAATLKAAWAALWVHLWIVQRFPDGWLSMVIWAVFAATVVMVAGWPEEPPRSREPS